MNRVNIFHAVCFLLIYCSVQKMLNVMLASNCNDKIAAGLYQRKVCLEFSMSWTLEQAALTKDLDAPSQIFLITKDLSTLFFLSLVLASSYVRPSLCLLSVLSQLILNGFTCNRSLIENEFLSQIYIVY